MFICIYIHSKECVTPTVAALAAVVVVAEMQNESDDGDVGNRDG